MSLDRPKLADVGALIRGGKLPERTVPVCLAGELVAQYETLEQQLRAAAKVDSLDSPAGTIRAQLADLAEQMAGHTVEFRLRALPRRRFRELMAAHPPRTDEQGNRLPEDFLGFSRDAFFDALLRESIVEPTLDQETLTLLLEEKLTDRQYEDLTDTAWFLNRNPVNVPFSPAASPSPTTSGNE